VTEVTNGYVYLIREISEESIPVYKIGWSVNPFIRQKDLQTGNYRELSLINVIPGNIELEKYLHKTYKKHNIKQRGGTEWFKEHSSFLNYFKNFGTITEDQILEFKKNNSDKVKVELISSPNFEGKNHDTNTQFGLEMRPWQRECFNTLKYNRNGVINAPTAAGKTFAISWLNQYYMEQDSSLRSIIVVPESLIGNNFIKEDMLKYPDKEKGFKYIPNLNLCTDNARDKTKTRQLEDFLKKTKKGTPSQRTAIVCYSTLRNLFKKDKSLFENVHIVCDESHHISSGSFSTDDEFDMQQEDTANQAGKIVKEVLGGQMNNVSVMLVTATFFRNDGGIIAASEYNLPIYRLSYYDLFKETELIKGFRYNFVKSPDDYVEGLRYLLKQPDLQKTIIYIPHPNSRLTISDADTPELRKNADVLEVFRAIAQDSDLQWKDINEPDENGVIEVYRGMHQIFRVMNFVDDDPKLRNKRKQFMQEAQKDNGKDLIDYIITLNMMIEGVDWKHAQSEIIIGIKNSLNQLIQMSGRLFRQAPDKDYVHIYNIIPYATDVTKEALNMYLVAFFGALLLEDVCSGPPIRLKKKEDPVDTKNKDRKPRESKPLSDFISDKEYKNLLKDSTNDYIEAFVEDPSIRNNKKKIIDIIVNGTLKKSKIPEEYRESFAEEVIERFKRLTAKIKKGNNELVKNVAGQIDILEDETFGFLNGYMADGNMSMFEKIAGIYKEIKEGNEEEWLKRHNEVIKFWEENGRYPSRNTILGRWISYVRSKYNLKIYNFLFNHVKNHTVHKNLYEVSITSGEEVQLKKAQLIIKKYPNGYDSIPSKSTDKQFFHKMKMAFNGKITNVVYKSVINLFENIPGWENTFVSKDDLFLKKIKNIIAKYPDGYDSIPYESVDRRVFITLRKRMKNKINNATYEEILKLLNNTISWHNALNNTKDKHIQNIQALIDYVVENNKYPSSYSENIKEKKLGDLLSSLIQAKNNFQSNKKNKKFDFLYHNMAEKAGLPNLFNYKTDSNYHMNVAQSIINSNIVPNKKTQLEINSKLLNINSWIEHQREGSKNKSTTKFSFEADKLFNQTIKFKGILRPQGNKRNQKNGQMISWQPGMGRGLDWDIDWIPCTPADIWYNEVSSLSPEEIERRKIDLNYAKKELESMKKLKSNN